MTTATTIDPKDFQAHLETINVDLTPVVCTDRHISRKDQAALTRKLFKQLGIKGTSVTAPNYSMAQSVHIEFPRRNDYATRCDDGGIDFPNDPAAQANCRAEDKMQAILARAFPNHGDRSDSMSDYFNYKWSFRG